MTENSNDYNGDLIPPKQERGDEADHAAAMEGYEREVSLKKIISAIPKSFPPDFDGCCLDCGDEIPEVRLKLFCVRCVDCQTILEKKAKR